MSELNVPEYLKPCPHARPQDASQLHGVCIFCYRDRLAAKDAKIAELKKEADACNRSHEESIWPERDGMKKQIADQAAQLGRMREAINQIRYHVEQTKKHGMQTDLNIALEIIDNALTPAPSSEEKAASEPKEPIARIDCGVCMHYHLGHHHHEPAPPGNLTKDRSTPENKEYWDKAEKTAEEVKKWPKWKRDIQIGSAPSGSRCKCGHVNLNHQAGVEYCKYLNCECGEFVASTEGPREGA